MAQRSVNSAGKKKKFLPTKEKRFPSRKLSLRLDSKEANAFETSVEILLSLRGGIVIWMAGSSVDSSSLVDDMEESTMCIFSTAL